MTAILISALLVISAACILLCRRCVTNRTADEGEMKKTFRPAGTGCIPGEAVLYSLNWWQSSANERECFAFNAAQNDGCLFLSGKYITDEGTVEFEDIPIACGQRQQIEQCLRNGSRRPYRERTVKTDVYDETTCILCVGWLLPDGKRIAEKYSGNGEEELLRLLKALCV